MTCRRLIDPFHYEYAKSQVVKIAILSILALLATSLFLDPVAKDLTGWTVLYRAMFLGIAVLSPNFIMFGEDVFRVVRSLPTSPRRIAITLWAMSCIVYPAILSGVAIAYAYFSDTPSSGWILASVIWTVAAIVTAVNTEILRRRGCWLAVGIVVALLFHIPTHPEDVGTLQIATFSVAMLSLPISFRRCEKLLPDFLDPSEPLFDELMEMAESQQTVLKVEAKEAVVDALVNLGVCGIAVAYVSKSGILYIDEGISISPLPILLTCIALLAAVFVAGHIKFNLKCGIYRIHRSLPISSFRLTQILLANSLVHIGLAAVFCMPITAYLKGTPQLFLTWLLGSTGIALIAAAFSLGASSRASKATQLVMATVPTALAVTEIIMVWSGRYTIAAAFGVAIGIIGALSVYKLITRGTAPYHVYGVMR